jgi:hypothetical protein
MQEKADWQREERFSTFRKWHSTEKQRITIAIVATETKSGMRRMRKQKEAGNDDPPDSIYVTD